MQWIQIQDQAMRHLRSSRTPLILLVIFAIFTLMNITSTVSLALQPTVVANTSLSAGQVRTLADLHVFGRYNSALAAMPLTSLQLQLEGTEVSSAHSLAIISSAGAPAKVYYVHDQVPGGAIIHAIDHTRVILNHNGILEQLRMPSLQLKQSAPQGVFAKAA